MALRQDGTVWTWGDNTFGQLGNDTTVARSLAAPVVGLQDVVAISLGSGRLPLPAAVVHALAVTGTGAVMGWGNNDYNQLGEPAARSLPPPCPDPRACRCARSGPFRRAGVIPLR